MNINLIETNEEYKLSTIRNIDQAEHKERENKKTAKYNT